MKTIILFCICFLIMVGNLEAGCKGKRAAKNSQPMPQAQAQAPRITIVNERVLIRQGPIRRLLFKRGGCS